MKAKLSFAIAMATEPDLFIIDETLAVGDAMFRLKCHNYIKSYIHKNQKYNDL